MIRVLAVLDYFLPGSNAGGPIRTLTNLVEQLAGEVEFSVLTRDRDYGDTGPYVGTPVDAWTTWGDIPVRYVSPTAMGGLAEVLAAREHDLLYLNSVFSRFTRRILALRRMGRIPRCPVVLAPRGELMPGPLAIKRRRKAAWLAAARAAGLFRGVVWQATSELERSEILARFPDARVVLAPNPPSGARAGAGPPYKRAGEARFVFLSRVTPKKNLEAALRALAAAPGQVLLHLYGNLEDPAYWERCRRAAAALPPGSVEHRGPVPYDRVQETLGGYHFFILPTRGENYGHAIVEALHAGLPVLISDRTPWRGLQAARAGWDVPLDDAAGLAERVRECVEMDESRYREWSEGARRFAAAAAPPERAREQHLRMFRAAAAAAPAGAPAPRMPETLVPRRTQP